MSYIFIVCGYGIPQDITKDENYNFYLKTVFNRIFGITQKNNSVNPLIILSGGKTDCFKPYRRTEAGEMKRFFATLAKQNRMVKEIIKQWRFVLETRALSTVENFINSKNIISDRGLSKGAIVVFCEQTRQKRVTALIKRIFGKGFKLNIVPVDFDTSSNRYLDKTFIEKKERISLQQALQALKNPKQFEKYHAMFVKKARCLREAGTAKHTETVRKLWEKEMTVKSFNQ